MDKALCKMKVKWKDGGEKLKPWRNRMEAATFAEYMWFCFVNYTKEIAGKNSGPLRWCL